MYMLIYIYVNIFTTLEKDFAFACMRMHTDKRIYRFANMQVYLYARMVAAWPIHHIVSLLVVCARINRRFVLPARLHCPHCCNTIARLLGNIRPPTRPRCA